MVLKMWTYRLGKMLANDKPELGEQRVTQRAIGVGWQVAKRVENLVANGLRCEQAGVEGSGLAKDLIGCGPGVDLIFWIGKVFLI
jgi:hypothetical protein